MRTFIVPLILPLAAGWALVSAEAAAQTAAPDAEARVIVKYRAESALLHKNAPSIQVQLAQQAAALGQRVGRALIPGATVAERVHVVLASGTTSEELAARLAAEGDIEYAVPDVRRRHTTAPNDPLYLEGPPIVGAAGGPLAGQWYLRAPAGQVQSSINVEPAWDASAGGASIVVAIIDTGIRYDHADLLPVEAGGTLLPGYDMVSDITTANDGDGRDADASDPGDWISQADIARGGRLAGCSVDNSSWHGTQTASLVGALTDNGIGMAGIGRNVRILPVRVLGKCGGFDSDILAGMRWAAGLNVPGLPLNPNPARVLNMSLGADGPCNSAYTDAAAQIVAAGSVIVVSAGNASGHAVGTPANCQGVIAVAGLRHFGTKVGFSSLGPQVAISAPGGNCVNTGASEPCLYPILTAANSGSTTPVGDAAGGSVYTSSFQPTVGTSFSAPLVAGTVALMLSVRPALASGEIVSILRATARPFPATGSSNPDDTPVPPCVAPRAATSLQFDQLECYCTTTTCGAGMLDAGNALALVASGGGGGDGGGGGASSPPGVVTVTEFYHPQFNHYFITADPAEADSLAAGNLRPWVPTGVTFNAWSGPGTDITSVCRFFSASFMALSSHFYSNNPAECPSLQTGGIWVLESANAFYLMTSPAGACPPGTTALYRLYNNGAGGAPNHRYTTEPSVRSAMIRANWTPEGNGPDGVFACVPI